MAQQMATNDLGIYRVSPESIKGINLLIYGYQGVGKTVLAASAQDHEEMADVLFLNVEGGLMSIAHRKDVLAVDIESVSQMENIWSLLKARKAPLDTVRTVVIDSITELQTLNLEEIVQGRSGRKDLITREDYMKSTNMLKRLLRMYRDLPINVIYNALPKEITPEGGGPAIEILPSMTRSLANSVMGYMDLVWYMYSVDEVHEDGEKKGKSTGNKLRKVLTQEAGVYRGKTRGMHFAEAIGNPLTNPTMSGIYDTWKTSSD